MLLENLGFDSIFTDSFTPYECEDYCPARVTLEHKGSYMVHTEQGEMPGLLTGKMYYEADDNGLPIVGDWVVTRVLDEQPPKAIIHAILPRRSKFSRKEPGKKISEQPLAANIDTVFIVVGLDNNFNVRRIERYLTLTLQGGAEPVVLLTKSDLCEAVDERLNEVLSSAPGVPVHAISVLEDQGLEQLSKYLLKGRTVALLGSSGVGKSTIINYLLGKEAQKVNDVRVQDSRGRHTTTHRQLFILPSGALMIDTPGIRELQLWNADEGVSGVFSDIEDLARCCRFQDCSHRDEPGCKVRESLDDGTLDPSRFENYQKMLRELGYLARKQDDGLAREDKLKWKKIRKDARKLNKK